MMLIRFLLYIGRRAAFGVAICLCIAPANAQGLPQVIRSHNSGPGQCGSGDPSYINTANETGGVPLFLQRDEAGKAMQLMFESSRKGLSTVLWASARLTSSTRNFDVPVDSVTDKITFTFSVDNKGTALVLRQPNGHEAGAGAPGVTDTELNCGRVIAVVKPRAGVWHAEISGTGTFWLKAQAQTDIDFIKAEFVESGGRPGHEGLFPIQGQPIVGQRATLRVWVSAAQTRTAEVALISSEGNVLRSLHLEPLNADRKSLELTGEVMLPTVPFRIALTGRDVEGVSYQRLNAPLFHAESVKIVPKFTFDEIAPGTTRSGDLEVRNFGPSGYFKISAVDARKLVRKVEPAELFVAAHETGRAHIRLVAPAGTSTDVGDDVVIVVASMSGTSSTNSAIVHLSVSGKADP